MVLPLVLILILVSVAFCISLCLINRYDKTLDELLKKQKILTTKLEQSVSAEDYERLKLISAQYKLKVDALNAGKEMLREVSRKR